MLNFSICQRYCAEHCLCDKVESIQSPKQLSDTTPSLTGTIPAVRFTRQWTRLNCLVTGNTRTSVDIQDAGSFRPACVSLSSIDVLQRSAHLAHTQDGGGAKAGGPQEGGATNLHRTPAGGQRRPWYSSGPHHRSPPRFGVALCPQMTILSSGSRQRETCTVPG